ncbi:MAG: ribokinase [Planctomycetota bacterium]|jgi:ribokinase
MTQIYNFGSVNIDHVYSVDRFPRPGETLGSRTYRTFAGGKGFNQSIALARAGADVCHAGRIGSDGLWLKDLLERDGVDARFLDVAEDPTGHAIIFVNPEGENSIVLYPGANHRVTRPDVERVLSQAHEGDYLLTQNETSSVADMIRLGAERGLRVAFNPAPMDAGVKSYPLDLVSVFIVNEVEGAELTGETSAERIIEAMRRKFPRAATVLTLGSDGVAYGREGTVLRVPAEQVHPVDTTAAGDTFIGYFLAGVTVGNDTEDVLERACRAAAICVTRPGAADSIPTAAELEAG